VEFTTSVARRYADIDLADDACGHLTAILHLRRCTWHPGYHGTAGPVLLPTGAIMGYSSALPADRAVLLQYLEIPATVGSTELGRFIATPHPESTVSIEERLTAAAIVALFASVIDDPN
jgi:hypothetical protein